MTKRTKWNIGLSFATCGVGVGLAFLLMATINVVNESHSYNYKQWTGYISDVQNNPNIKFSSDTNTKALQVDDLKRCWDQYTTYPDSVVVATARYITLEDSSGNYQQMFSSKFVYGDKWHDDFLLRNCFVTFSIIGTAGWALVSTISFIVANVKYKKPKEMTHGKTI
ncbi:MAG: hypothetical protein LBS76_01005 [Mycoplasmataceae bacterium]|jgi:hypothetical protein|nr:hypothetical protein [Mycoplasmataceae bacterium]